MAILGCFGCSTEHYVESANTETAGIIAQKSSQVPNMDPDFSIEPKENPVLEGLPVYTNRVDYFGMEENPEIGARVIDLEKALELAVNHNRNYQTRKETVFLSALQLTLDRHNFTPIFSGRNAVTFDQQRVQVAGAVDELTTEETVSGSGSLGASWLLKTGGRVAADFTADFLKFVSGDSSLITGSRLAATFTQPLWRGAGYRAATENLTQSERNVLYELRDFTRFRREFIVNIANQYYRVLQDRDSVRNNWQNYRISINNSARQRSFFEVGQAAQTDLGRFEEQELSAESRWIDSVRSYRNSLDSLKIELGLSTEANVVLDESDLANLEIAHPQIEVGDAVEIALQSRLDLYNQRDSLEDASRRLKVVEKDLPPQVDFVAGAELRSSPRDSGFPELDLDRYAWSAGLEVDWPFDRKSERNSYRRALITYERSKRDLSLAIDDIKQQIRDGWRQLDQARRNYEISKISRELNERRLREQEMYQDIGRGNSLDLVEAQNALLQAQLQETAELVNHTIRRLGFYRDMGILMIQENGQWEETQHAKLTTE